ncbi:hypothetical protein [Variovorax sp. WS11]|uniref:hypothetical protein n=1 Tax=Variovorax sp. WS11 TaxID=1105204 RepID=UPI0031BB2C89
MAMVKAALPPAWVASKSMVAPRMPGAPAGGVGAAAARRRSGRRNAARGRRGCGRGLDGGLRSDTEGADAATRLVPLGRAQGALPARIDALDQAARRQVVDRLAGLVVQRQPVGDHGQRRQVEPVGAQRAALGDPALRRQVLEPEVAARPAHAVGGLELQVGGGELQGLRRHAPGQPAGDGAQHQRLERLAQRGVHAQQCQVGRAAGDLAVVDIGPDPQRAIAFADAGVERHVLAQLADVDARQLGVGHAVPAVPVAGAHRQQGLAEGAEQPEALAPAGRRRGVEAHRVAAGAVAGDELHVGQQKRRGAAALVGPAHGAAPDHELALAEEPVGPAAFAGGVGVHAEAGHVQLAGGIASHFHRGILDVELLEVQAPQRARRDAGHHPCQAQGLALLGVVQHHFAQLEARKQGTALGRDGADAHRYPDGLAGLRLERATVVADSRHNPRV